MQLIRPDLLCYFGKLGHVAKQSLMFSFCTNFYGSELWDLGNPSVQDFSIAWRKELMRVWGLPYTMHCDLLPVLANTIPILDELHPELLTSLITACLVNVDLFKLSLAMVFTSA